MKRRIKLLSLALAVICPMTTLTAVAQSTEPDDDLIVDWYRYQPGDLDMDGGDITAADALMALQAAVGKTTLTDDQKRAADMDNNGIVQVVDALTILQIATGKLIKPARAWLIDDVRNASTDFALELMRRSTNGQENTVVCPLSVQSVLAMIANGAQNDTLSQMEQVLAGGRSVDELNHYLAGLRVRIEERNDPESSLTLANALWLREGFAANESFLQTVEQYYNAQVTVAPFDEQTRQNINQWVAQQTDDMIPELLEMMDPMERMLLVNAVLFQAEWREPYDDIRDASFTTADGQVQQVEMMNSTEYAYLQDDHAVGFIKPYEGDYSFVALLPEEGMSVDEYLDTLTGEHLREMTRGAESIKVYAAMPKFQARCRINGADILESMGMTDAFDPGKADLSGIANDQLYVSRVVSECAINVDEYGTKAAAATIGGIAGESPDPQPEPFRVVTLDRPFVYAIVENITGLPVFFGRMMSVE